MNIVRSLSFAALFACSAAVFATPVMVDGEIRKVDKEAAKLTIRHAELKNLDMKPMTMVFRVSDKAMLDQVAAGDKVRFAADRIEGAITVTVLEVAK